MLFLLAHLALAEMPIPSFRDHLGVQAWYEVDEQIEAGNRRLSDGDQDAAREKWREAIARAEAFEETVLPTAGLAYLRGLAHRYIGEPEEAEKAWRRSIELDAESADVWHDLGELLLVQGRYDEAREAFTQVAELSPTWLGPYRLAIVAGHEGDPAALESHLREAMSRGLKLDELRGQPNWREFYANPTLHDSIEKLVLVYGDPEILDTLK